MNSTICNNCRRALQRTLRASRAHRQQTTSQSTVAATLTRPSRPPPSLSSSSSTPTPDLTTLLSRPTWSVRSLLPPTSPSPSPSPSSSQEVSITPKTLHHLLRLSALPLPKTAAEESQMLGTLSSQLHFVRAIQGVDTSGVSPLRVIRDETAAGLREQTIGLAELREALEAEDVVGHARRPRRRRVGQESNSRGRDTERRDDSQGQEKQALNEEENWDVLGGATETAGGRYFVVRSGGTGSLPNGTVG